MNKTYMTGFKELLTDLFDSPEHRAKTIKGGGNSLKTFHIYAPTINILAGSTVEWFNASLQDGDIASGFLPRFNFAYVDTPTKEPKLFPQEADEAKKEKLAYQLFVLATEWQDKKILSDEAKKTFEDYSKFLYESIRNVGNPNLDAFYTRLSTNVIKLALIIEGTLRTKEYIADENNKFNNVNIITEEAMIIAVQLAEYFRKTWDNLVTNEFAFTNFDKAKRKVLKVLYKNKGRMTSRELLRAVGDSKKFLDKVLNTLETSGEIVITEERRQSGQTSRIIRTLS